MKRFFYNLFALGALWVLPFLAPGSSFGATPNGDGLLAQYFNNNNLSGSPVFTQVEENVNNFWFNCSPDPTVHNDNFSARYTGFLYVPYSEPYTFSVRVSDGARLWVNGNQVLNPWAPATDPSANFDATVIPNLTANTSVPITLEFYDNTGEATIQLRWSSPTLYVMNGNQQAIVPRAYLFSSTNPSPTPSPTPRTCNNSSVTCAPSSAIVIDGQTNEAAWSPSGWIPLTKCVFGSLVAGESASYQTRWNNTYLYLAVTVTTNNTPLYTDSPGYYYQDPALEVYLDTGNEKSTTLSANDDQFVIRAADNAITETHNHSTFGIQTNHAANPNGYTMECAIPWSTLGFYPSLGTTIGFDVGVDFDRDGGCRDALLLWNGKFKNSDDTSAYGNMLLNSCQTNSPTPTGTPTATLSMTRTFTPTSTWTASSTPTDTLTSTGTETPTSTSSPTDSDTNTPTPTFTDSPTSTPSDTDTFTPTGTPTDSPTNTPTWTPTDSSTATFSPTETSTFTLSWTHTPSSTPLLSATPTPTPTSTSTSTYTPTPTQTRTFTLTLTSTRTNTPTATPTASRTPTFSWTPTITRTFSPTPSPTATFSKTFTSTLTWSPSGTSTTTHTQTDTPTPTPTASYTPTLSGTPTLTRTFSPTSSPTASFSKTYTPIPSFTCTPTFSPTPRPSFKPYPDPFVPGHPPDDIATFPLPNDHGEAKLLVADLHRRRIFEKIFAPRELVYWDGRDSNNDFVRGGVYIYFLEAQHVVHRGTLTVLR
jgi:hypothetical protein